jgi:hypothetical protein
MKNLVFIFLTLCFPLFVFGQQGTDGWTKNNNSVYTTSNSTDVGIGTQLPKSELHVVGDLVLGLDQNNKKFIFHSRTNGNGDFLQITNDAGNGKWDWGQGILLYRGGNVTIGQDYTDHSAKLTVNGQVKIKGGAPGMGKVLTSDASGLASWQSLPNSPTLAIGDTHAGGIIFYLDETGQHGLVVTADDISTSAPWSNGVEKVTNATSFGVYGGMMNTLLIIAQQTEDNTSGTFAAQLCTAGEMNDEYGDWYLPSVKEWDLLDTVANRIFTRIPAGVFYWSSTEANEENAYQLWTGEGWDWGEKSTTHRVRAIRKF